MRFSRSRNSSRNNLMEVVHPDPPPPPPPVPPAASYTNVWSTEVAPCVTYYVRSPWEWVMKVIAADGMTQANTVSDLPTMNQPQSGDSTPMLTPASRRRRNGSKVRGPSTLKIEVTNPDDGSVVLAVHGTSSALDGMEDKDELVRTLQRCRCNHLHISPPSILMSWDVTHEECINVVGKDLPSLDDNASDQNFAVLKEPMGSQGKGIYFVKTAEEIHHVITEHRQRAQAEPDFLENLITLKGRIPSWVLQAEVTPSLLIKQNRKFHIRTYVVVLETPEDPKIVNTFIFNRHEIRIAGVPVPENDTLRDPVSHITNGALSSTTERVLLHNVDELTSRNLQHKTEVFVAELFDSHVIADMQRRVMQSSDNDARGATHKFAIAGLDIMVTTEGRLYLLEANINPAAPREATVNETFKIHLQDFLRCLVNLVVGKPVPEFLPAHDILVQEGLAE